LAFVAEAPKFKSALIQQFNLQVEQQIGSNVLTIGYVGNIGQHLPESINNINQPLPYNPLYPVGSAANPVGGARPLNPQLPNLGGVSYINSGGVSNYSALQTSFQRRFTKGLAFDANYTWGKALSDITGFSQQGSNQGWSDANPTNIRGIEYGIAENDIQNRFAISLNYELQYGKEFTGVKKTALSGWQINLISAWQGGKPFTIINSGGGADNPFDSGPADPTPRKTAAATIAPTKSKMPGSAAEASTIGSIPPHSFLNPLERSEVRSVIRSSDLSFATSTSPSSRTSPLRNE